MHAALIDLTIVAAGFLMAFFGADLSGLPHAGACAVLASVALATWRLRVRSESWRTLGLKAPEGWGRLALSVLALYLLVVVGMLVVVEPLARVFEWPSLNIARYAQVKDNALQFVGILAIVWTTAAIGEELLFRGFLLNRIEKMLGARAASAMIAVALQAVIFGAAHAYLGVRGIATAMLVGVVFGSWFVLRGRNLWPLIVAHGLIDTITLLAIYAGVMPR
jgi:uncharacterized protein